MRTVVSWSDTPEFEDEAKRSVVWDLAFKPDGSQLVAAYGRFILIYDAATGEVQRQKEGHSGDIYSLSTSKDGLYVASGGADKTVCVWTYELSMKYTFTHVESVQALAFNPVAHNVLASCSAADFAIWTMPSPQLRKIRVPSKILCAAWSSDGQTLALGMLSGAISLRDTSGAERISIARGAPVWDLSFTPPRQQSAPGSSSAAAAAAGAGDGTDNLVVACWDGTLSFYSSATGERLGREKAVGGDPCSVRHFTSGEHMVVAGADKKATLYTRDGVKLSAVAEAKDWVWRAVPRPRSNHVAIATNDGTIAMHSIVFSTVHGLYQDRYAFRDAMTDVVVQHLVSEQRVRIKCRDYVKKIAVYRDRLAVQLPDRIIIYELAPQLNADGTPAGTAIKPTMEGALQVALEAAGSGGGVEGSGGGLLSPPEFNMAYRVKDRINAALECNLLVVTSRHVILCQERKLQLYDCRGGKEREWVLEAVIRYIKVVGGPPGREGLLVGLKNGAVLKIFVHNPFPQQLIKHAAAIRCLDLSMSRRKLAVVDEASVCTVFDVASRQVLFTESGANSVSWNSEMEDMLCFSGNGVLAIKTGTFPTHTQKLQGFVVGFNGSKIFCLHSVAMQTIDVPQSASLYRYMEARDWEMAYRVACLGVTDSDWRALGDACLRALALPIARAAFSRIGDMRYLELTAHLEGAARKGSGGGRAGADAAASADSQLAEVLAYGGRYLEAAKLHLRGGTVARAIEMFADLRLWADAKRFAEESGSGDVTALMLRQASWCEEIGDAKAAATIYSAVGQCTRAVCLLGERGMYSQLIELVRALPAATPAAGEGATDVGSAAAGQSRDVREALQRAAEYFRRGDQPRQAQECYVKLGDDASLVQLHIDAAQFEEALALAQRVPPAAEKDGRPSLLSRVHLAYGEWLASRERLEEAQAHYDTAGRPDLSARIYRQLALAALAEHRFNDAALYFLRLSEAAPAPGDSSAMTDGGRQRDRLLAQLYRAYAMVHCFATFPFAPYPPDAIFFAARFVLQAGGNLLLNSQAPGISRAAVVYTLARQAVALGAYKTARAAIDQAGPLLLPPAWRDTLDVAAMHCATKPIADPDNLASTCYRCATVSSGLLPRSRRADSGENGDCCPTCGQEFQRCMLTFDVLPLVEFVVADGSASAFAAGLAEGGRMTAPSSVPASGGASRKGGQDVLHFDGSGEDGVGVSAEAGNRAFNDLLQDVTHTRGPVEAPSKALGLIKPSEIFVKGRSSGQLRFFKNVIPDLGIGMCGACGSFFSEQEHEFELLKSGGACPACKHAAA